MQAIIIMDGTVEEIAALILAVQEQHGEIDVQDISCQFQEGIEDEEFGMPGQWTADLIGKMHLNEITTKQLAAEVGWHPNYLSAVLNRHVNPKNAEKKLKDALEKLIAQRMENC